MLNDPTLTEAAALLQAKAQGTWRPFFCPRPDCDGLAHGRWEWNHARADQRMPEGDWATWVCQSGRGAGKSRLGAETILVQAEARPGVRIAIVAPTSSDISGVVLNGPSGILTVAPPWARPHWNQTHRELRWPNGSVAQLFSAEEPDRLRGPQFHLAWLDEAAHFARIGELWPNLLLGMRLGERTRVIVTTTPTRNQWLRDLVADPTTIVTRTSTYANLANLADSFRAEVVARYEGTSLGRQELHGEILSDVDGALWSSDMIDRVERAPELTHVVVAVDPAMSDRRSSDETGIVVAGRGVDGDLYVLEDYSGRYSPDGWAQVVTRAFEHHQADVVVVETNQGGGLVRHNLTSSGFPARHIRDVRASTGKVTRAEAIVGLYERGHVHHLGGLGELEEQMVTWCGGRSPDRIDALVWAIAELDRGTKVHADIALPTQLARRHRPTTYPPGVAAALTGLPPHPLTPTSAALWWPGRRP